MIALLAAEPWIQASRVEAVVGMDKAAVSRSVPVLEQRGLVATRANVVDPRRRELALTPAGRKLHDEIAAIALKREQVLLSDLNPDERSLFLDLLKRIRAGIGALDVYNDPRPAASPPRAPATA